MTVVRGGSQEQFVLAQGGHQAQHLDQIALLAHGGRGEVVRLVHNEQIPWQVGLAFAALGGRHETLQHIRLLEVVVTGDDARTAAPGIGIQPHFTPEFIGILAVHQVKREREFAPQFVLPLLTQRSRGEDEHATDAAAQEQFLKDECGFHRLAQADIIGNEKRDAGHTQGLEQGNHLVVFDLHGTMERAGDGVAAQGAGAIGIHIRRAGHPPTCANDRQQVFGRHGFRVVQIRKRTGCRKPGMGFPFPDEAIFHRLVSVPKSDLDQMQLVARIVRIGLDCRDDPPPIADGGDHARTGEGGAAGNGHDVRVGGGWDCDRNLPEHQKKKSLRSWGPGELGVDKIGA